MLVNLEEDDGLVIAELGDRRQGDLLQLCDRGRFDPGDDLQALGNARQILETIALAGRAMIMHDLGGIGRDAEEFRYENEGQKRLGESRSSFFGPAFGRLV